MWMKRIIFLIIVSLTCLSTLNVFSQNNYYDKYPYYYDYEYNYSPSDKYIVPDTDYPVEYVPYYPYYDDKDFVAKYSPEDYLPDVPYYHYEYSYKVQLGAFRYFLNAARLANKVNRSYKYGVRIYRNNDLFVVVTLGTYKISEAKSVAQYFAKNNLTSYIRKWYPVKDYKYDKDHYEYYYDDPEEIYPGYY